MVKFTNEKDCEVHEMKHLLAEKVKYMNEVFVR